MHVVEASAYGGPEVLRPAERPDPVAGPGEVVVRIQAASINPTDLATRASARFAGLQPPFVPGWDLAGVVESVGAQVGDYQVGQRVVGMIPFGRIEGRVGAYAERAAVDPAWLAPLPDNVSFEEGATLPLNALTAAQALDMLPLTAGEWILITGASGGVGGFAVSLAKRRGLLVIATASHGDEEWVRSLGADEVVSRDKDLSTLSVVDGVLDAVPIGPTKSTPPLRASRTAVFTRPPEPSASNFLTVFVDSNPTMLAEMARLLGEGALKTRVARVLPFAEAAEGHRLAEAGGLRGKVVLRF